MCYEEVDAGSLEGIAYTHCVTTNVAILRIYSFNSEPKLPGVLLLLLDLKGVLPLVNNKELKS